MGAFFRRILAFLLGFIMAFVAVFGGIGLGAYWAYKNLSLSTVTDDGVVSPIVDRMTIEDFVADLQAYMNDPNSYTIGEIEEKYGIDLSDFFGDFAEGLDDDYKNIQFLALLTGDMDVLLGSISLRVVLGFMPEGLLSEQAMETLGSKTVLDLVKEEDTAVKLNELFGRLKVGDILGIVFEDDSNGNITPHYTPKAEYAEVIGNRGLIDLIEIIANVEISALVRALSSSYDNDILDEIMNYGLTEIGDLHIGSFVEDFLGDAADSLPISINTMIDKQLRDIIGGELHDYSINPIGLLYGMTIGKILGYTENNDGVFVDLQRAGSRRVERRFRPQRGRHNRGYNNHERRRRRL